MEQLVARWAHNPKVVGSSPAPATTGELQFSAPRSLFEGIFFWEQDEKSIPIAIGKSCPRSYGRIAILPLLKTNGNSLAIGGELQFSLPRSLFEGIFLFRSDSQLDVLESSRADKIPFAHLRDVPFRRDFFTGAIREAYHNFLRMDVNGGGIMRYERLCL